MNTNALAKHYGSLTPLERLPLLMAASVRGDEAEWQRLVMSAPKVTYRVPHQFGTGMALGEVSNLHFMEALHLSAMLLGTLLSKLATEKADLGPLLGSRLR